MSGYHAFVNRLYSEGEGKSVSGVYRNSAFSGKIDSVRIGLGSIVHVYVQLDQPIQVGKDTRDRVVLEGEELYHAKPGQVATAMIEF